MARPDPQPVGPSPRVRRIAACALACALALPVCPALAQSSADRTPRESMFAPAPGSSPLVVPEAERPLGVPSGSGSLASRDARSSARPAGSEPGAGGSFVRTTLALLFVVGLMVALGAALRFFARARGGLLGSLGPGGPSPSGVLEILGRYPVGRGQSLVLLKLDRRVLLLSQGSGGRLGGGGGGGGFRTLCEITDSEEVASILVKSRDAAGDSMSERFRTLLSRFDRAGHDPAENPVEDPSEEPGGRRLVAAESGDRTELWDEALAPMPVVEISFPDPAHVPEADLTQGAAGAMRRRLESLRSLAVGPTGPDGGGRP